MTQFAINETKIVGLPTKEEFDNVEPINAKPTAETVGFNETSGSANTEDGNVDASILQYSSILYKQNGEYMSQKFLKFIVAEKSKWLRKNYPNAFLILSLIAERARRTKNNFDGLEIGDAIIGAEEAAIECGLTRDKVRTAIKKLEKYFIIEIVVNTSSHKKIKKRPTRIPTSSMIVNLLDTDIWDINSDKDPHVNPHVIPTSSPRDPHKQEGIRMNKKEEEKIVCPPPLVGDALPQIIKKFKTNGEEEIADQSVLFRKALSLKKDWTTQEIMEAWKILNESQSCVNDWFKFIEGTIKKIRNKVHFEKHEKNRKIPKPKEYHECHTKATTQETPTTPDMVRQLFQKAGLPVPR